MGQKPAFMLVPHRETPHGAGNVSWPIISLMQQSNMPDVSERAGITTRCEAKPPRRILVVDDDFETGQISSCVLTRSGYEVDIAADGAIAWRALNCGHYDLLITNYRLPRISGIELMVKLHDLNRVIPVIMVSARLPGDQFARHPWLNPPAMLLQPCTVKELLDAVDKVLGASPAVGELPAPAPTRQVRPASQWLAHLMLLLRGPALP